MTPFANLFNQKKSAIIAEIKYASPTHPALYQGKLTPVEIASSYLKNGAQALSVLTEPSRFKGNISTISQIRQAHPNALILQKDFILEEKQIDEGKAHGADAILLIAKRLSFLKLKKLYDYALKQKLTPFVEVYNLFELQSVLTLNPPLIAINNRNIDNGDIDLSIAKELIKEIPATIPAICASGIEEGAQINEYQHLGFKGFLIGTAFMKHADPGIALANLMKGLKHES